jgi:hypothetical protein
MAKMMGSFKYLLKNQWARKVHIYIQTFWLIINCFMSHSRIFHLYGDITITGEGLQNLGLCSVLRVFEQGGSLSCHTCCDTRPRFYRSHPKDSPIHSPPTTDKGMWRISSWVQIQSPPTTRKGILKTYFFPDPHGAWGWYLMQIKFVQIMVPWVWRSHSRENHIYIYLYWRKSSPEPAGLIQLNLVHIILE